MNDPLVHVFSLSTCSHCKDTCRLLEKKAVAYEETKVDLLEGEAREGILENLKTLDFRGVFPFILIGDQTVRGFREEAILRALRDQNLIAPGPVKSFFNKILGR